MIPIIFAENEQTPEPTNTKMIVNLDRMVTLEEKAVQIVELEKEQGKVIATLVDENGLIELFTDNGNYLILNTKGQILSEAQTGIKSKGQKVMLSKNGSVYICDGEKTVVLFKDGSQRFVYETPLNYFAQSHDGTTFLLSEGGHLKVTDINGEVLWESNLGDYFSTGLCVGINKAVIALSDNGNLYLLNSTGETILKKQTQTKPSTTPIVDMNGDIYFGSKDSKLIKLSSEGEKLWEIQTTGTAIDQPVFDFSGNILFPTTGGIVYSVKKATGEENWKFYTDGGIPNSLSLSQTKNLYFTTNKNNAYALSTKGILQWKSKAGIKLTQPVLFTGKDSLIIPAQNAVYILQENTGGIAKSAWACLNGNQQRRQSLYTQTLHRLSTVPYGPTPLNGETKTGRTVTFKWKLDMETKVDFYLGTQFPLTRCGINIKDNTVTIPGLLANTVYYWRVEPKTDIPNQAIPNWTFRTGE